jgi:UDP-N-acetylglucosamine 1-carboxyvinyltransferase
MYPGRMFWIGGLEAMGARLVLCDPHRVVVVGPSQLYGAELRSPDIRAGMALLGAALCAKGTSVINNVEQIDRGYEDLDTRLRALGAKIERVA